MPDDIAISAPPHRRFRRWIWAAATLVLLFALYVLAGFFWVPSLVRSQAQAWVRTNLDKDIALGEIRFNPLTFTLDVSDVAIAGRDGPMVALGHLRISFAIQSLVQSAWGFNEVTLDRPFVRAVIRPDGALNLIELVPRTKSEGPSPAVRIGTLTVDQGRIAYADHSQPGRPEENLTPIAFTLKDFHTKSADGGDFTLSAQSERGETFGWTGALSIAPIASKGRLTVASLQALTIQKFLGARLPVTLKDGRIGFRADYDFAYGPEGMRLNLSLPQVTLAALALDGRKELFDGAVTLDGLNASVGPIALRTGRSGAMTVSGAMPRIAVNGLHVSPPGAAAGEGVSLKDAALTDSRFDLMAQKIDLGSLTLNGANISVRRAHGGAIDLMAMLPQKPSAPVAAPVAAPAPAWTIGLKNFALTDAALTLDDKAVTPAARVALASVNFSASGAGDMMGPLAVKFDAAVNGGHLGGEGTVTPGQQAGDVKFTLTRLPLRPLVGYMPPMPGLDLRSGAANASGNVHFEGADMAALRFDGDAGVDNFALIETSTKSPLFAWRGFALTGIAYAKDRVAIGHAKLVAPVGQVALLANRQFNFTSLMAGPSAPATAVPIQDAPPAPEKPVAKPVAKATAKPAIAFALKQLDISKGTTGFADYSVEPNFAARIEELQGHIANITNKPGEAAAIDLTGQVIDRFSPVTIKGRMDLLGFDQLTDMQLAFRNIDLPVFNPYSGRYAGYAISKGKLTTELSYKIDHRALKAEQHVIIDQLEWGAATDSKDSVPLPVRLATALLKDKDGVIDLSLPVTGSLDDPAFSIWPIVWKIVGNIIEKAVTAPFQLIGSLFAGADKAQFIDFAPGDAALPQGSAEALGALAKAMVQRPVLKLDIPAGPATPDDAAHIADARIDAALIAKEIKAGKKANAASLDADERHDRLEDLYAARVGKSAKYPDFTPDQLKAAPGAKPDADDSDRRALLETVWLHDQLHPLFLPPAAELTALGSARATAVRDALLADGSVDPARVFLTTAATATATEGHSRVALKFE